MFGCGTGIVVVSIREILYEGKTQTLPYAPVVLALRDTMTALHRGKKEYQDWLYVVPKWKGVEKQNQVEGEEGYAYT
jgi:branched-chain amino acid aminotransferase